MQTTNESLFSYDKSSYITNYRSRKLIRGFYKDLLTLSKDMYTIENVKNMYGLSKVSNRDKDKMLKMLKGLIDKVRKL